MPEPGAAMLAGAKLAVIPLGNPLTERARAELKAVLAFAVTNTVPLFPAARESELAFVDRVNEAGARMVSVLFAVLVSPPPIALMVRL